MLGGVKEQVNAWAGYSNERVRISGALDVTGRTSALRLALVGVELLLNDCLRPGLLARRLMLGLELHLAALADPDRGNILDSLYDTKITLGHAHSLPQFSGFVWDGHFCPPLDAPYEPAVVPQFRPTLSTDGHPERVESRRISRALPGFVKPTACALHARCFASSA
jgi:hypothetical protein